MVGFSFLRWDFFHRSSNLWGYLINMFLIGALNSRNFPLVCWHELFDYFRLILLFFNARHDCFFLRHNLCLFVTLSIEALIFLVSSFLSDSSLAIASTGEWNFFRWLLLQRQSYRAFGHCFDQAIEVDTSALSLLPWSYYYLLLQRTWFHWREMFCRRFRGHIIDINLNEVSLVSCSCSLLLTDSALNWNNAGYVHSLVRFRLRLYVAQERLLFGLVVVSKGYTVHGWAWRCSWGLGALLDNAVTWQILVALESWCPFGNLLLILWKSVARSCGGRRSLICWIATGVWDRALFCVLRSLPTSWLVSFGQIWSSL